MHNFHEFQTCRKVITRVDHKVQCNEYFCLCIFNVVLTSLHSSGVSVEMPPLDSDLETITLRGEPDKLGRALTQVYEKASSVISAEVDAPRWLHRFIIGRKGQNIRKITQDLPKV